MALTKNTLIKEGSITTESLAENVRVSFANTSQFAEISARLDSAFSKANTANDAVVAAVAGAVPKITTVEIANSSYTVLDDTAVSTSGGYLVITGTGFTNGSQVLVDRTPATSTTYVNSTTLRAQVGAKSAETYNIYVVNSDGGTATKINGLTYSGTPTWVTGSTLANVQNDVAFTGTFEATGATSYANTTALPAGFNLVSANGYYYGTISIASDTTYNFTISAIDDELQNSDRTFTLNALVITAPPSVEYLVVAGGGGTTGGPGAYAYGGGGGGGYRTGTLSVTTSTQYTVTVGSGGASSTGGRTVKGQDGSSSTFGTITSNGGGAGGAADSSPAAIRSGNSGGSGGGGGSYGAASGNGGTGNSPSTTPSQGNNGGAGGSTPGYAGAGGGGGAGASGGAAGTSFGGTSGGYGGNGLQAFDGNYYAGGGGGGAAVGASGDKRAPGGLGGGGKGASFDVTNVGTSGTENTGGGGGGGTYNYNGYNGGSGIVIVRYSNIYDDASATTGSPTYTNTGGYKTYKFTGSGSITW